MKLTAVLMFLFGMHVAAKTHSQLITYEGKNVSLKKVFSVIKKQTGYLVFYNEDLLKISQPVTIKVKELSIESFVEMLLKDQPLDHLIKDNTIVILRKSPAPTLITDGLNHQLLTPSLTPPPITVRGRILNEKGEPVIASVTIKGTNRGTTSDVNGEFEVSNIDENATIIITSANTETIQIKVDGNTTLNVRVKSTVNNLDEVIINKGYYSEKQRFSTGNISKVDAKDIQNQPVTNPLIALQGRMPGVDISPRSGVPGGGINIQIRGQNSIRFDGGYPLYVVDGVVVDSKPIVSNSGINGNSYDPLSTINSANIESIEVLKDADATSIYGSRGANGVVLITTKRGTEGKIVADVNFYRGFGNVVGKLDMLQTSDYIAMRKEAFKNDGISPGPFDFDVNGDWDTTRNTDWQKELLGGTANTTDIQTNISGGSRQLSFRAGFGFHNEGTVFPDNSNYRKFNGQLNVNYLSLNKKLSAIISLNYGRDNRQMHNSNGLLLSAIFLPPNTPNLYNEDGTLNWGKDGSYTFNNPLAALRSTNEAKLSNLNIGSVINYKIVDNLSFTTRLGYTEIDGDEFIKTPLSTYFPGYIQYYKGESMFGANQRSSWIIEPQVNYSKKIGEHSVEMLIGSTAQENYSQLTMITASGYTSDALLNSLRSASSYTVRNDDNNQYRYTAIFGRVGYNFKEKYLLNITGRRDGSSRFAANNKFGNFGALGAAWILTNEKFFANNLNFINFAKIRSSYGVTGNDQIGDYKYYNTFSSTLYLYNNSANLSPVSLYNPDYEWEKTKKFELAIQLAFFNDRISSEFSYYNHKTSNQLIDYQLPLTTGFGSILRNMPATIENSGWEFLLNTRNIQRKDFKWSTSINLSLPKNKLSKFDEIELSPYATTNVVGKPVVIERLFNFIGINRETGQYEFEDHDSNGEINESDRYIIRPLTKIFFGGVNNEFQLGRFQLSFLFQFGQQVIPDFLPSILGLANNVNQKSYDDRWNKPGDISKSPRLTTSYAGYTEFENYRLSNAYFPFVSFVRLKTIGFTYQISEGSLKSLKIRDCKIFLHGQNILTYNNADRLDPETGNGALPPLRFFTAGFNVKF